MHEIAAQMQRERDMRRAEARRDMPDQPIVSDPDADSLNGFEVVLAKNLHPPYRFRQDYYWLEVFARDHQAAVEVASRWVVESGADLECTDLVRAHSSHPRSIPGRPAGSSIPISWSLPIDRAWAHATEIRNPINGIRVGFIAEDEDQRKWLRDEDLDMYRLIVDAPVAGSVPVCAGPLVTGVTPLRFTAE